MVCVSVRTTLELLPAESRGLQLGWGAVCRWRWVCTLRGCIPGRG